MFAQADLFGNVLATNPVRAYTGSVIYETSGKAREYRELACNLYTGCDHGCTYCWAPDVLKKDRCTFDAPQPRTDILAKLRKDATGYARSGDKRQVLFCFTCDPYQVLDVTHKLTRSAIMVCHDAGLNVCVLTKGGARALRDIDLFWHEDAFATTLTCIDTPTSLKWEPDAAIPTERMQVLGEFHNHGIPTWVSLEPVLDPKASLELIKMTRHSVDEYKVGKINYNRLSEEIDWHRFVHDAVALLERYGKSYYIKKDLKAYW